MEQREAHKRLVELADGWECAARLSDEIVRAFQPDVDAFSASRVGDSPPSDLRLIRAVLDERSARDRFLKDAAAVRVALDALALVMPDPTPSSASIGGS